MAINEAPWLTTRLEILLMIGLFVFCLLVDVSKCKTGYLSSCIGGWASACDKEIDKEWCYDYVVPPPRPDERSRCDCTPHTSQLLIHVLEVGTKVALSSNSETERPLPLAPFIEKALEKRAGRSLSANASRGLFGAPYFSSLRRLIELDPYDRYAPIQKDNLNSMSDGDGSATGKTKRQFFTCGAAAADRAELRRLNISYGHDIIVLPTVDELRNDLTAVIPFRNDYFAIRRHLPELQRRFERLISERSTAPLSAKSNPCSMVHLVLFVVFTPGTDPAWASDDATRAAQAIVNAQTQIVRTISRYLRKKPRYTRMLDSVHIILAPMGYPVRSAENEMPVEKLAAAHCPSPDTEVGRQCRLTCTLFLLEKPIYTSINEKLQQFFDSSAARRPLAHTLALPFKNYFPDGSSGRKHWHNCLYLNKDGAVAAAEDVAQALFS